MIVALPLRFVCAWCQRVRTSQGRWERVDPSEARNSEASHGICPDCLDAETRAVVAESCCR
jgi:hypothetical protein